jgi:hypothetical protein
MNARIRELADQAEYYADGIVDQGGEFHEAYTKKFAELIIQECTQLMQARKYADPDDSAEHYVNQGLATGVSLIKQHFGVK